MLGPIKKCIYESIRSVSVFGWVSIPRSPIDIYIKHIKYMNLPFNTKLIKTLKLMNFTSQKWGGSYWDLLATFMLT